METNLILMGKRGKKQDPEIRRLLYMEALAFEGWFKASQLYFIAPPPSVTSFLNSMLDEEEMIVEIFNGTTMYRWVEK